jgi:hypothetical protein
MVLSSIVLPPTVLPIGINAFKRRLRYWYFAEI